MGESPKPVAAVGAPSGESPGPLAAAAIASGGSPGPFATAAIVSGESPGAGRRDSPSTSVGRGIYAGSTASLVGKKLTCMGYGDSTYDQGGYGTLRLLATLHGTIRTPDPFESPLANNVYRLSIWDPCNGGCFNWTASYDFESGYDHGHLGSASLDGAGTLSGSACGQTSITALTDGSVQSPGFSAISATCQSALQCFGPECFTAPMGLPDNANLSANWNPCFGACYTWTAAHDMESGYDHVIVDGHSYTGAGTATGSACGIINVKVDTDVSYPSAGARVTATCPAPRGPCHTGNTCGSYSSSGACWCDQGCMAYGDCCSDGPC